MPPAPRFDTTRQLAALVIFLYPALVLLLFPADSTGLVLLALGGFWVLWRHGKGEPASREEKLFYFALSIFFLAALATTLLGGIDSNGVKKLNKFAHLLLAIPAYLLLRRVGVSLAALWYGLVAGAMVAALAALYEVWGQPTGFRARGVTHPIIFGDLALAMGIMSLAGLGWFSSRSRWLSALPILAAVCGLLASLLSHARGGWVAIPFLMLVFVWFARAHIKARLRWSAVLLLVALLVTAFLIPATGVRSTIERTTSNISGYFHSDITDKVRETSVGSRFEMWQAAWQIFKDNPLFGIGWGHYKEQAQILVDTGIRNKSAATWGNPHNQFLSAMANGGVVAFVGIMLLFLIPARLFANSHKRAKTLEIQQLSLAGLVLIVAYICFGLSESILERVRPASFFGFYMAVLFAAIQTQLQAARNSPAERKQSLSVIIIAQDEADRIEPCLQSVTNWADEVIVLDSGSSDNTVEIARRYTDKVFETDWPGYGPQKQRALEKASCDWVLAIDADERVTPELRHDIDTALNDNPKYVGYCIPLANMVYGHRMDFGRSARSSTRLFKREGARYTDFQVHEHVALPEDNKGSLEGRLLHCGIRDYGHALAKNSKYSWLGGQQRFAAGKRGWGGLPAAAIRAIWNFVHIYFFRLGVLDGPVGFLVAVTYAQYTFNKYAALWTLQRAARQADRN